MRQPSTRAALPWLWGLLAAAILVLLLYLGRSVLVPMLLAVIVAYVLGPVIDRLERWGLPRALGILVLGAGLIAVLVLAAVVILPEAQRQAGAFADRLPAYGEAIRENLAPVLDWIRERYPNFEAEARDRGVRFLKEHLPSLLVPVLGFFRRMTSSLVNLVLGMLNLVVIPVLAYYLLKDKAAVHAASLGWIPPRWQAAVRENVSEVDGALRRFLRGQLTVSLILVVLYSVGLSALGVPLGVFLGVVAGLANLVPYLGIAVGLLPSLMLSALEDGDPVRLLGVVGVFGGAQVLEGTLITPRVVGKEVGLHPAVVLLVILVGGSAFGFLGILLAVPFTAAASVLVRRAGRTYLESEFYSRPAGARRSAARRRIRSRPES